MKLYNRHCLSGVPRLLFQHFSTFSVVCSLYILVTFQEALDPWLNYYLEIKVLEIYRSQLPETPSQKCED